MISKEQFLEDATGIEAEQKYHGVYLHFHRYFQQVEEWDAHQLVLGMSMIYSWMPKILHIKCKDLNKVAIAVNQIKAGQELHPSTLTKMKSCFNNSLVGPSKFLHFLEPSRFAIWDSRVARYFLQRTPHHQLMGRMEHYFSYLDFCSSVANEEIYDPLHQKIQDQIDYPITKMRSIEYVMFLKGVK